jgi:4-hydroxybenzoate polyprenyltransferase
LGIFAGVVGSDGVTNLTGDKKLGGLISHLDSEIFDYIGNDLSDLPLLARAKEPMVANPTLRLKIGLRTRKIHAIRKFEESRHTLSAMFAAVRPHQWAKNLLIFLPLFLSHALTFDKLFMAFAAFCCFSLTASAGYLINDLLDIEADRRHPDKRRRPFASGDLSALIGLSLAVVLLLIGLGGAVLISSALFAWLFLYLAATLSYSWYFKAIPLVDVLALSGLYILRLLAGGAATLTSISHWLTGFSMFLFLSLAVVKRFAEMERVRSSNSALKNGRGYRMTDLEQLRAFGTSSAYAAVLLFCIYIGGSDVTKLYRQPEFLWLIAPLMLLWINWVWLLASRGELDEDPVIFAITHPKSQLMGVGALVIALFAWRG